MAVSNRQVLIVMNSCSTDKLIKFFKPVDDACLVIGDLDGKTIIDKNQIIPDFNKVSNAQACILIDFFNLEPFIRFDLFIRL